MNGSSRRSKRVSLRVHTVRMAEAPLPVSPSSNLLGALVVHIESTSPPSYDACAHGVARRFRPAEGRERHGRRVHARGGPPVCQRFLNATRCRVKQTSITGTPLGTIDINQNLNGPRASVNATWTIYSGGRITATQRALAAGVDQARAELTMTEEQLDLQLAQVYFGLELASNIERTRTSVLQQADRQFERAVRFEQQGIMARVERLNAQVSRDEAARELVRAQHDRQIAQARLQRLLHRDVLAEPSTPLFVITNALKPLPEWLSLAGQQNPLLATFDAKREQAQQGIVIAESRWKPEVFAFGS